MLAHAAHALLPLPWLALILAVVGAAAGPALARLAATRTVAQPLSMALPQEGALLGSLLNEPHRLPYLTPLTPQDFAAGAHSRIWAALRAAAAECDALPEDATDEQCAAVGEVLRARRGEIVDQVRAALAAGPAPVGDLARLDELVAAGSAAPLDDATAMETATAVLGAGQDRNRLSGAGLVLPTSTPDSVDPLVPPLHRVHVAPSPARTRLTAAVTLLAAALTPALVLDAGYHAAAAWMAGAAVLTLLTLSVLVSLVDIDTFYIDLPVFAATGLASWVLAVAAVGLDGDWGRLLDGVGVVVATGLVFEGANRVHRLVRGEDGQGFGDTLIVLATAGVPAALAGSWGLGYCAVMAGMLLGVLGWVVGAVRGRLGRRTPFAFGPYLAAGWVLAWVITVAQR